MSKRYKISHLADIEAAPCPCGFSRRAFMDDDNEIASIHLVDIKKDSQTHYLSYSEVAATSRYAPTHTPLHRAYAKGNM